MYRFLIWENTGMNMHKSNIQLICTCAFSTPLCYYAAGVILKTISFQSLQCFWSPQRCSLHVSGPRFPVSVGPWDWLITSFVPEGKRGMSTWLILTVCWWRDEKVFFFLFPGHTSGPLHPRLLFNHDKWSNFLKALGRSLAKWGVSLSFVSELLQRSQGMPFSWLLLLFSSAQMGAIVPGTAGWFSEYFEHDGKLLYQIWVMWTAADQFP